LNQSTRGYGLNLLIGPRQLLSQLDIYESQPVDLLLRAEAIYVLVQSGRNLKEVIQEIPVALHYAR
jgi:hypothetical protein